MRTHILLVKLVDSALQLLSRSAFVVECLLQFSDPSVTICQLLSELLSRQVAVLIGLDFLC